MDATETTKNTVSNETAQTKRTKNLTTSLLYYREPFIESVRKAIERADLQTKAMVTLICRMQIEDTGKADLAREIEDQFANESDAAAFHVLYGDGLIDTQRRMKEAGGGAVGFALLALIAGGYHEWDGCGSEKEKRRRKNILAKLAAKNTKTAKIEGAMPCGPEAQG
jgi:hypothetical protein